MARRRQTRPLRQPATERRRTACDGRSRTRRQLSPNAFRICAYAMIPSPRPPIGFTQVSAGGRATSIRRCQPASPVLRSAPAAPRRQRRTDVAMVRQGLRPTNPARSGRICWPKALVAKGLNPRAGVNGGRRPPAWRARSAIDAEHGSGSHANVEARCVNTEPRKRGEGARRRRVKMKAECSRAWLEGAAPRR
jgi:hypothetical protein